MKKYKWILIVIGLFALNIGLDYGFSWLFMVIGKIVCGDKTNNMVEDVAIIRSLFVDIVMLAFLIPIFWDKLKESFNQFKEHPWRCLLYIFLGILIIFGSKIIIGIIFIITGVSIETSANQSTINDTVTMATPALALIFQTCSCIFTPLKEEIMFRLGFNQLLKKPFLFLLITSIVFGLVHALPTTDIETISFLNYCFMGFAMAFTYYKTNNIWCAMIVHAINNLIVFLI